MGTSRIVRIGIALLVALAAGFAAMVCSGVALTIVELYLSGHSLPTLSENRIGSGQLQMSVDDVLFLTITLASAVGAGVLAYVFLPAPEKTSK